MNHSKNSDYLIQKPRHILTLTRRQFLGALSFVFFIPNKKQLFLENDFLAFRISPVRDGINSLNFENKLTGKSFSLQGEVFLLKFKDGKTVSSGNMQMKYWANSKNSFELYYSEKSGLEVRVLYSLAPGSHYLRKQISLRHSGKTTRRLIVADLENWQGVSCGWNSMHADPFPFGSHPIYCDNLWAGVEFPAAFNEYNSNGFILRSRPGGKLIGHEWINLNSTVVGVAETGKVRDSFLNYIDDIRVSSPRITACYNSWWTLPEVVLQRDNLALIKELKAGMYDKNGVFFDIITTDGGWSKPQSIWEIDRSILPQGFDDIRSIVDEAGGKLGLWMSPGNLYPTICDYEWAEKNGYTVVRSDPKKVLGPLIGLSLADPKYREETKEQLKKLIRENKLGHIKYDAFLAIEYESHHDLLPGEDSVEPIASYSLELLQVSKEADPNLVTEPTYMNSFANYISPWIIKYSDTVWGNAMDCVVGIGPAPDYRESHTNAREYMIFRALDQIWLPQNALQYFDITHVDEREGFPNHAAMAFGRGCFFISTYLNPKLMNDDDWRIYAGLLRWARMNSDILRNTNVIRSSVESGEPYTYAHWLEMRGILVVRNPTNQNQEFQLDLMKTGAPSGLANAICYTQYPYRHGIAENLTGTSTITLKLAPWELLFLEIIPCSSIKETVVIGGRWYHNPDNTLSIVPDHGLYNVKLFEPGKDKQVIPVIERKNEVPVGKVISLTVVQIPENQWLTIKKRTTALFPFRYPLEFKQAEIEKLKVTEWKNAEWIKVPTIEFQVECSVSIPLKSSGKLLLLVEFPGRNHYPGSCKVWIDDLPANLEIKSSDEHIGFFGPNSERQKFESEWNWYICNLPDGSHRVKFKGIAGHANPRFGLWIWSDEDLSSQRQVAHSRCTEPAMPQYRDQTERQGVCLAAPKTILKYT